MGSIWRTLRVAAINVLIFLGIVIFAETALFAGRLALGAKNVGYLIGRQQRQQEADNYCTLMKTHPILSHVHDDRGRCAIKDGVAKDGFVYYEESPAEPDGYILTLGGSTTDGYLHHFSNGDTYPLLLNRLAKSSNLAVINGGVSGYGSTQELLKLVTDVPRLGKKIKYVVTLDGVNDLYGYADTTEDMYMNEPFMTGIQHSMYANQVWIIQGLRAPKSRSLLPNIVATFYAMFGSANDPETWITRFNIEAMGIGPRAAGAESAGAAEQNLANVSRWASNIRTMKAVADSMGAIYLEFLQPTLGIEGPQSSAPAGSPDARLLSSMKADRGYLGNLNESYREMRKICATLPYCRDISNVAPPLGNVYANIRHHNAKGNAIIAQAIFASIVGNH